MSTERDSINWTDVVYYDESSPSCLRWAINIPYKGLLGGSAYKRVIGEDAGCLHARNNRYKIKYQQMSFMVHRVVWELFHGKPDPDLVIDHIDGNGTNNKISNLRLVDKATNARNMRRSKANTTGVSGIVEMNVDDKKYGHSYHYYGVCWATLDGNTNNRKYFSRDKLGDEEAFRLACEYREKMIAELNAQGAGYTERHGT
jgi:hypothetical protein